ncbi:hypothetical protein, variant [Salpingoeca rosetta]|nr:hypothetical protein, variant [Salpingoeca rosetta]EGD75204.1 hypothetical protein, variant [Salpingoeca rosetta]|eukprot:XP_004992257.1 hypothetical protein, variant [Salpingoeca rosetta]
MMKGYSRLLPLGRSPKKFSHQGSVHERGSSTYTVTLELGPCGRLGILTAERPNMSAYSSKVAVVVREVLPGSPAWVACIVARQRQGASTTSDEHAILQPGDIILKANEESLCGLSREQALARLREETEREPVIRLVLQRVPASTRSKLNYRVIFPEASVDSAPPSSHSRRSRRTSLTHFHT